ncbi:MAG: hypothetical protein JWN03_3338, partial [Nocardia sp.]|nr:hypothetical protein [Nocardia sp.]
RADLGVGIARCEEADQCLPARKLGDLGVIGRRHLDDDVRVPGITDGRAGRGVGLVGNECAQTGADLDDHLHTLLEQGWNDLRHQRDTSFARGRLTDDAETGTAGRSRLCALRYLHANCPLVDICDEVTLRRYRH